MKKLARPGLVFILLLASAMGLGLSMVMALALSPRLPTFSAFRARYPLSDWVLLDHRGRVLQENRMNFQHRRPAWIPLSQVSPALGQAIVFAEDRRFFRHHGIDWVSLLKNSFHLVFHSGPAHGASTITMQLVSLLDAKNPRQNFDRRSLPEKLAQLLLAFKLEHNLFNEKWNKEEILEAYLNVVSFRGELQGISSASRGLMKKHPQGLTSEESYVLAALIPAPNASMDRVYKRAAQLYRGFHHADSRDLQSLVQQALLPPYRIPRAIQLAPQAALYIRKTYFKHNSMLARGPAQIKSTLDLDLQILAKELLDQHLSQLRTQNVHDGAVLVVENATGKVRAYVGNGGSGLSSRSHVDGVMAKRPAGSTLKPFLYAQGIEDKIITAASLLLDSPLNIPLAAGIFAPQNYDHQFKGAVTVREALASSLNIPAVKTLDLVGTGSFVQTLKRLHIAGVKEGEFYGPSLALGGIEVSLWEMVNAFRTLVNLGAWSPLRPLDDDHGKSEAERVFTASTSFIITDILSDREARASTFSLESPLATSFWTAVKTGTSKDMKDNWCLGASEKYTVGIWVGNFSGESMWNVSGVSGAAPLWASIMKVLHQKVPSRRPLIPKGESDLVLARVTLDRSKPQSKKTYNEYFLTSTAPRAALGSFTPTARAETPKILYPPDGLVVALDPDIPKSSQRIPFQSNVPFSAANGMRWFLNGAPLKQGGSGFASYYWTPAKGRHQLTLQGRGKRPCLVVVDQVAFTVR